MHRLYRGIIAALAVVALTGTTALADSGDISQVDNLRADVMDGGALLISWTEQNEGPFTYTVTLCNNDTMACQLAGTTIAKSFILDNLDANTGYDIHVGAAGGNAAGLTVTTPETEAKHSATASSVLYGSANESAIGGVTLRWIGDTSLIVSWTEEAEGSFRYSISLRGTDAPQPVLQGTTTAWSFVMDGLEPGAGYCIQIDTDAETAVSYSFTAPEPEEGEDDAAHT